MALNKVRNYSQYEYFLHHFNDETDVKNIEESLRRTGSSHEFTEATHPAWIKKWAEVECEKLGESFIGCVVRKIKGFAQIVKKVSKSIEILAQKANPYKIYFILASSG
ncbi:MAG: hypothetical protein ACYC27_12490 [Armatimonadota bacterium]